MKIDQLVMVNEGFGCIKMCMFTQPSLLFSNFFFLADINECELNPPPCDVNADCNNTIGSFTCECNYGYNGDGMLCTGMVK